MERVSHRDREINVETVIVIQGKEKVIWPREVAVMMKRKEAWNHTVKEDCTCWVEDKGNLTFLG